MNLFLGWTFIGWIISLVWAVSKDNQQQNIIVNQVQGGNLQPIADNIENKKCPMCAEIIKIDAKKCKHCGEPLH